MTDRHDFVQSPPAIEDSDEDVDYDDQSAISGPAFGNSTPSEHHEQGNPDNTERGIIPTIRNRLFGRRSRHPSSDDTNGGSFFRPNIHRNYGSIATMNTFDSRDDYRGPYRGGASESGTTSPHGLLGDAVTDGLLGRPQRHISDPQWLAKRQGVKHDRYMYVAPKYPIIIISFLANAHFIPVQIVLIQYT